MVVTSVEKVFKKASFLPSIDTGLEDWLPYEPVQNKPEFFTA